MNVDLPADVEGYLRDAVASGQFTSEEELLAEAVRMHRERASRLRSLKADLDAAIDSLDRGEGRVVRDEEEHRAFFAEIERRGRERFNGGAAE